MENTENFGVFYIKTQITKVPLLCQDLTIFDFGTFCNKLL